MDFLIISLATALLSLLLSIVVFIAFINCGVFPRPEGHQFLEKLYWRRATLETVATDLRVVLRKPASKRWWMRTKQTTPTASDRRRQILKAA
jgi:hypothetical protein